MGRDAVSSLRRRKRQIPEDQVTEGIPTRGGIYRLRTAAVAPLLDFTNSSEGAMANARRGRASGDAIPAARVVIGPGGRMDISDGNHRLRAAIEAGDASVLIHVERGRGAPRGRR